MSSRREEVFCFFPWVNSYVSPSGNVSLCYESSEKISLGNLQHQSFSEIWNGEKYNRIRKKFQCGEGLDCCRVCLKNEEATGRSLRTSIEELKLPDEYFSETIPNTPLILDLAFSNLCNLKCEICNENYSSKWEQFKTKKKVVHSKYNAKELISDLRPFMKDLKKVYLSGGEPFFDENNVYFLSELEKLNLDVQLYINTNGSIPNIEKSKFLKILGKFKNVKLSFSLDGHGAHFEDMRKGGSWKTVVSNIDYINDQYPHFKKICYTTLSTLNITEYPDFVEHILDTNLFKQEEIGFNFLRTPQHLSVQNLDAESKKKLLKDYRVLVKTLIATPLDMTVKKKIKLYKSILSWMS